MPPEEWFKRIHEAVEKPEDEILLRDEQVKLDIGEEKSHKKIPPTKPWYEKLPNDPPKDHVRKFEDEHEI